MVRRSFWIHTVALAVGISGALAAQPASAATITQISYTVSGGMFGQGPGATAATGTITGGSVTVQLGSGVSTTPSFFCFTGICGTANIVWTGAAGYVKATLPVTWAFALDQR